MKHTIKKYIFGFFQGGNKKKNNKSSFVSQLMILLGDILLVYKKFVNWNYSKILIYTYVFFLMILVAIPFLFFIGIIAYFSPFPLGEFLRVMLEGNIETHIFQYLRDYTLTFMSIIVLLILLTLCVFIIYAYKNILLVRLYSKYIDGKTLSVKNIMKIRGGEIWTFVKISLWQGMIFGILSILGGSILFFLAYLAQEGRVSQNIFIILVVIVVIKIIFIASYVVYRLIFSYVILAHTSKNQVRETSAIGYLKASLGLTKSLKPYALFLVCSLILFSFMYPFIRYSDSVESRKGEYQKVLDYRISSGGQDMQEHIHYEIALKYEALSSEDLLLMYDHYQKIIFLIMVLSFFVYEGIYFMLFTSLYTRILHNSKH